MKFTNYFSKTFKTHGRPQLDMHQLQRMMNIVYLESSIETMEEIGIHSSPVFTKVSNNRSKLKKITKDLSPKNLLNEMIQLSQNN